MSEVKVLIMAGGTGGHIYPALAVAARLRCAGAHIDWLGSAHGPEAHQVVEAGYDFHPIAVRGLRGKGVLGWLLAPLRIAISMWSARKVLHRVGPHVVLGMGGYVSGPGAVMAWLMRCPLIIHEQNAVAGLTNRILTRIANQVLEAFPGSFPLRVRAVHTGNPVRAEIAALVSPADRQSQRTGPIHLLVLGGSQGARFLNELVPAALAALRDPDVFEVRHQAGAKQLGAACEAYRKHQLEIEPIAYIEDMAEYYAWADLIVCRAGAMTIAELSVAGVAAVLVPLPHAVDDHQTANARFLSDAGAALLVPESELNPSHLARLLEELGQARDRLLQMALRARELALVDADQNVASYCLKWAEMHLAGAELPNA